MKASTTARCIALLLPTTVIAGCIGIGPNTIPRDRFDYGEAISSSFKEQMLLNLVRIRYVDTPTFVEVSSVINQYSLEGEVEAGFAWSDGISDDVRSVGGRARYADRPTITYAPVLGQRFAKSLMHPLPPGSILFLAQSGWSVDFVFKTTVQAICGVNNRAGAPGKGSLPADPEFLEVIDAMQRIQRSGAIGMRVEDPEHPESTVLVFRRREDPAVTADLARVQEILQLPAGKSEFRLIYGADRAGDDVLAIQTRSLLEIMIELAAEIDVPPLHVEEGRTYPSPLEADDPARLVRIHSGEKKPEDCFISVRYRDHWFWIDDRDMPSKRVFAFLVILYNLTQTSGGAVPLLTVPT